MSSSRDIVISGISGRYPESLNIQEFWDKLLSGQELSSIDDRRYPVGEYCEATRAVKLFKRKEKSWRLFVLFLFRFFASY